MKKLTTAAALALLAVFTSSFAEVRSGFWVSIEPSKDTFYTRIDLSELAPFCSRTGGAGLCPQIKADADFSLGATISAPYGICHDSIISAAIQSRFITNKNIAMDREGLFYLDSMMKAYGLQAPQTGYATKIAGDKGLYFIRTSENRAAVMIKSGEYIGGLNRIYYYWAYQSDTGNILYKNALYEIPNMLDIEVDAFSGRPSVSFQLSNSEGKAQIMHAIYIGLNTYLDPSIKRNKEIPCSNLGYRRLTVWGMFGSDDTPSTYAPTIQICSGSITYNKVPPFSSAMPPLYLNDPALGAKTTFPNVAHRADSDFVI
jgi:hypothetical protein